MIGFGQQTYVPDDNFEQRLINLGYDLPPLNDYVYTAAIDTVTNLLLGNMNISDLTGIENFTLLKNLHVWGNPLLNFDLSNNYYLEWLTISNSNISYIDLSNNLNLQKLNCSDNQLTLLDLSSNDNLGELDCSNNQLTSLLLPYNNTINSGLFINCSDNLLITLDVRRLNLNYATQLDCSYNNLDTLIFSANTNFLSLICNNNNLTSLDMSEQHILGNIDCSNNQIASLEFSEECHAIWPLFTVDCSNNPLTYLKIKIGYGTNGTAGDWCYNWVNSINAGCNPLLNCVLVDNDSWSFLNWSQGANNPNFIFPSTVLFTTDTNFCPPAIPGPAVYPISSSYDTIQSAFSIQWNNQILSVTGDYTHTLINSEGCDSIANLNLIVTTTGISDIANSKSNLVKITDMLGQETPYRRNTPLFYIYDDGTVEKRIVIE